jgi:hypothetical protein
VSPARSPDPKRSCWPAQTPTAYYSRSACRCRCHLHSDKRAAGLIESTGEPPRQLLDILGHSGTDYQPVHPTLVVEAETEPTVTTFNNRLRPRVHRLRTDLTVEDIN